MVHYPRNQDELPHFKILPWVIFYNYLRGQLGPQFNVTSQDSDSDSAAFFQHYTGLSAGIKCQFSGKVLLSRIDL